MNSPHVAHDPLPIVAFLTDFGTKDHYVGAMKGVVLSVNRRVQIVDISHEIYPQDVTTAYFVLQNCYRYFPTGTIFVAVVDPGVGSPRPILCVETPQYLFLAPDNGILSFLEHEDRITRIFRVTNRKLFLNSISATFHGRDIFAPVAAHLSLGLDLTKLGPRAESMRRMDAHQPHVTAEGHILGQVVNIDRFGNLITDIRADKVTGAAEVRVGKMKVRGVSGTYSDARKGSSLAYIGSSGTLEIAVAQGNAARKFRIGKGETVQVVHKT